ncbi:MAG: DMT family transporter [Candidatus Hodarchaeales archaeon]|jgi:drug/metabolite transporter (DMT)-like permease
MHTHHKAQAILLIATVIWGLAPIAVELLLDHLTPLQTVTLRFGIGVLLLTLFLPLLKRGDTFSLLTSKTCIVLGWVEAFGLLAATTGQEMTTAGLATLLSTSFVFIVPFLAWKLEGTDLNLRTVVLASIALMGIFFISFNGDWSNFSGLSILGILILMLAAILFGLYIAISGKFLKNANNEENKLDLVSFTYASLVHTFLPLFVLSMITMRSTFSLPLKILPLLLFLGIFPTIIAFLLYHRAITRIGSVSTSFYLVIQVIIPFLYELAFSQQNYSPWVLAGIFVLLLSLGGIREKETQISATPTSRPEKLPLLEDDPAIIGDMFFGSNSWIGTCQGRQSQSVC